MTLSESLIKKWSPLMKVGETPVTNVEMQKSLAQLLENTRADLVRQGFITEAHQQASANQGPGGEVASDYGYTGTGPADAKPSILPNPNGYGNNAFYPTMILPVLRRVYPELIAHELVGVQAMNQPIGFVAVYRARLSGLDGHVGRGDGTATNEIGFPPIAVGYTGISTDITEASSLAKQRVSGTKTSSIDIDPATGKPAEYSADSVISDVVQRTEWSNGSNPLRGTRTEDSWVPGGSAISGDWGEGALNTPEVQFADIVHGTYPTVTFGYETREVVAKTRKLGAHWSPELAEDMQVMNNINVETEFINSITYEIGAQIDRQILNEMFKMAIASGNISVINAKQLMGIDGPSKVVALLARINYLANLIAMKTRRGGGNFIVASPKICSFLTMLGVTKFVGTGTTMPTVPNTAVGALQKVGLINDGQQLLIRDTYAAGDYALIGYRGKQLGDTGIIYAPYVPIQITKAMRPDSFTHELGARTRYGMVANPLDGGEFYTLVKIVGADSIIEGAIQVDNYSNGQH